MREHGYNNKAALSDLVKRMTFESLSDVFNYLYELSVNFENNRDSKNSFRSIINHYKYTEDILFQYPNYVETFLDGYYLTIDSLKNTNIYVSTNRNGYYIFLDTNSIFEYKER